ncbi:hypothetical protein MMC22_000462 [Lobaria immixta]|nr:hypothetical protein [Lobaria immixta]
MTAIWHIAGLVVPDRDVTGRPAPTRATVDLGTHAMSFPSPVLHRAEQEPLFDVLTAQRIAECEGGQLSRFYDRLNNGDQFGIVIRNHAGAVYCDNAQHCNNDGGEFRLSKGGFVYAKTRRDNEPYFTPEVGTAGKSPFRKFMGHDGIEQLWLSNDRNGTVKISHEIK